MYKKIDGMNKLKETGVNMHRFFLPNSKQEFIDVINHLEHCTIRTDHNEKTEQLPFFIYHDDGIEAIEKMWVQIESGQYRAIISDGVKFDNIQEYNMTLKMQRNGHFEFEASELKIPLRSMYKHYMGSYEGNVGDDPNHWICFRKRDALDLKQIGRDLQDLYLLGMFNKWLEITKYPIEVGIQSKKFIFWQVI